MPPCGGASPSSTWITKDVSSFIWSSVEDRNGCGLESSLRALG